MRKFRQNETPSHDIFLAMSNGVFLYLSFHFTFAGYNRKRLLQIGWPNNSVFIYIKHSHFATTHTHTNS